MGLVHRLQRLERTADRRERETPPNLSFRSYTPEEHEVLAVLCRPGGRAQDGPFAGVSTEELVRRLDQAAAKERA